jgi:hypothetical protein
MRGQRLSWDWSGPKITWISRRGMPAFSCEWSAVMSWGDAVKGIRGYKAVRWSRAQRGVSAVNCARSLGTGRPANADDTDIVGLEGDHVGLPAQDEKIS